MKKKSIKKVIVVLNKICCNNDTCYKCPLQEGICFNSIQTITTDELEITAKIIKEYLDNEKDKNDVKNNVRQMD